MESVKIKLIDIDEIREFVNEAMKVDGEIDVHKGRYVIDGKSIMGMMSIDVFSGIEVFFPPTAADFKVFLTRFTFK